MNERLEEKSEVLYAKKERNKMPRKHYLEWRDGVAVCISCDSIHTTSISPEKYDWIDGKAVVKSK